MVKIDVVQMVKQLQPSFKKLEPLAYGTAKSVLRGTINEFLREDFDTDAVVVELSGPTPEKNPTTHLDVGNLFSFLGFNQGKDLISPLKKVFRDRMDVKSKAVFREKSPGKFFFSFRVKFPTDSELEEAAPAPPDWDTRPWIRILEEGIPGFAFYVYTQKRFPEYVKSRSTTGLQYKKPQRFATVGKITFMSHLIARLTRKIEEKQR